jgi:predicted aspartyl protease
MIYATLDMAMDDTGRITVPVAINGTAKDMMVDTGTPYTMITAQVVHDTKLKIGFAGGGKYVVGFGGVASFWVAHIDEFGLGKIKINDINLFIEPTYMTAAGLFRADFMSKFDVELDFARAKLNLIRHENCPGGPDVYWTQKPYGIIPFEKDDDQHITVKVTLDGREITAILDTGAADTVMSLDKASDAFKLDEKSLRKSRHYPFKTLTIGQVSVANPAIELVTDKESALMGKDSGDLHMIVGMGVLRRLHLYISYKEKQIYVTPATQY